MLTDRQHTALDFQRHLSVTANAGAGKTTVLVRRYLEILLNSNTRANEIVAITFTEKAANELRRKIAERVELLIRSSPPGPARLPFERIREQLSSATIGTIHSFCAQLLRTHPVETDVDAAFNVIEGVDQSFLQENALQDAFELLMREEPGHGVREDLLDLVRMFGQSRVTEYLRALLEKREQIDRLHSGLFSADDAAILKFWEDTLTRDAETRLSRKAWGVCLENLIGSVPPLLSQALAQVRSARNSTVSVAKKLEACRSLLDPLFTKKHTLVRKIAPPEPVGPELARDITVLSAFRKEVVYLSDEIFHPAAMSANADLLRITRTLLRVYTKCLAVYEERKSDAGMLDFEDLQLKARALLTIPEIRSRLTGKYKYVMVDEFQDTNRLQYEIVRSLVDGFAGSNLFIVGDPKQSIYGFRNAEVEVFERAKNEMMTLAGEGPGSAGSIVLSESFRPLPNLIAFVNMVFGRLMDRAVSDQGVGYDELTMGREFDDRSGNVEFLLIPQDGENDDQQDTEGEEENVVQSECRMIARRLLELKEQNVRIVSKDPGAEKDFDFGDAAILLRSRTHVPELERVFLKYGIPYVLMGGIGFYQTQEVSDILNYFKFLLHQGDDVALAGILRSPLYTVSDAELFEISLVSRSETFWEKLNRYSERQDASASVRRAVGILCDHIAHVHRLPIPQLAERIFRMTAWHGTVSGLSAGTQYEANVKKLLRMARDFESKGYTTLFDFVERLKTLVSSQEREGQAAVHASGNSVQIMTIHSAKGLEFPVVVLPFLHKKFQYDKPPFIDADAGIGLSMDAGEEDEECAPAFSSYLKRRSRERTEEEEKRIFYVACTRARDVIILSGVSQTSSQLSYMRWIQETLGDLLNSPGVHVLPAQPLRILQKAGDHVSGGSPQTIMHKLALRVEFNDGGSVIPVPATRPESGEAVTPEIVDMPLVGQASGEFFSATQIKTYLECPTKYLLRYVLGIPEQAAGYSSFDVDEETDNELGADVEGIITHSVLQDLDGSSVDRDEIREKLRRQSATHSFSGSLSNSREEKMLERIVNFAGSEFGREILSAQEGFSEHPITAKLDQDFLTGTIDRLYRSPNGLWNIVDYKTDNIPLGSVRERADSYLPQLSFYAYLVSKLYGQNALRATLFFMEHPLQPVHYEFDASRLASFEKQVREAILNIKANKFDREVDTCESCPYLQENHCLVVKSPTAIQTPLRR
ncbi:MAG TPA: UvrD-helicase domain-containing protein [Bacteroidota bacterium]|nr:UvrD-helicase domain-containing protein [Bacteroidota bacterium]